MARKRRYLFYVLAAALGTLGILLLGVVRVAAQGSSMNTGDCQLLHTYADGRRLFLCPPELTATPTAAATPSIQSTATMPPTTPVATGPYPGAPLCPSHDPTVFHTLWDEARGCHYGHFHGDNPHSVDDIFGTQFYSWAGGEISYPWQTYNASGCLEDDCKHTGYIWLVRRDLPCSSQYADGCVVAFRALIHGMSSSNAATVRYHSAWLEAKVCRVDNPSVCGIFRSGGWQDSGDLLIDGRVAIDVPNNYERHKLQYALTGSPHFGTWYAGSPGGEEGKGGLWSVAIGIGDMWGPINPTDPSTLQFFCADPNDNCAQNGSVYQPHVVSIQFPPRFLPVVDPDGNGIADFNGYADRYGQPVEGCTSVGLDCVPLVLSGIPTDISYQGRFDYRDYDIYFGKMTSGWIKFPYPQTQ